jgi:MFS family permease
MAGVVLWGVHMGMSQGLLAALVADTVPAELRGTAFGVFNLASGVVLFFASLLAGFLWQSVGAEATFLAGAGFAALSFTGLLTVIRRDGAGR